MLLVFITIDVDSVHCIIRSLKMPNEYSEGNINLK